MCPPCLGSRQTLRFLGAQPPAERGRKKTEREEMKTHFQWSRQFPTQCAARAHTAGPQRRWRIIGTTATVADDFYYFCLPFLSGYLPLGIRVHDTTPVYGTWQFVNLWMEEWGGRWRKWRLAAMVSTSGLSRESVMMKIWQVLRPTAAQVAVSGIFSVASARVGSGAAAALNLAQRLFLFPQSGLPQSAANSPMWRGGLFNAPHLQKECTAAAILRSCGFCRRRMTPNKSQPLETGPYRKNHLHFGGTRCVY